MCCLGGRRSENRRLPESRVECTFLQILVQSRIKKEQHAQRRTRPMQKVETREWWLWGFAVTVTLLLMAGIVSLTYSSSYLLQNSEWLDLKEWVRGLACLVLLFDICTVYQQLQLHRTRRELTQQPPPLCLNSKKVIRTCARL